MSRPATMTEGQGTSGLLRAYGSTFLLTLTNLMTILSFAAGVAGVGVVAAGGPGSGAVLGLGGFLRWALWGGVVSAVVGLFRGSLRSVALRVVNRLSGLVIGGFGVMELVKVIESAAQ